MAWSWSHAAEAYRNAYLNFRELSPSVLRTIFAEWDACDNPFDIDPNFDSRKYRQALRKNYRIEQRLGGLDELIDSYWERIEELATCDNGGFDAWVCPHGCGCHTVSFDRKD